MHVEFDAAATMHAAERDMPRMQDYRIVLGATVNARIARDFARRARLLGFDVAELPGHRMLVTSGTRDVQGTWWRARERTRYFAQRQFDQLATERALWAECRERLRERRQRHSHEDEDLSHVVL